MQTTMVICYQPQQSQDGSRCLTLFATDYTLDYWLFVSLFVFVSFIFYFCLYFFFTWLRVCGCFTWGKKRWSVSQLAGGIKAVLLTLQYCMFLCLSSHSWAHTALDGWGGWGAESEMGWGGWVTFLPSGLCVCQPGHSQFSPGKLGGKNFLCAVHAGHEHSRTEACMHWGHMCACMCNVWNWAPGII